MDFDFMDFMVDNMNPLTGKTYHAGDFRHVACLFHQVINFNVSFADTSLRKTVTYLTSFGVRTFWSSAERTSTIHIFLPFQ